MNTVEVAHNVVSVRRFNRFYTQRIGVLREGLLDGPFSLTEARVLFELAHRKHPTAAEIGRDLDLDPGYLSRILRGFQRRSLVERTAAAADRRQRRLSLTPAGQAAFAPLDDASRAEIAAMLEPLGQTGQRRLVAAMRDIEDLLGQARSAPDAVTLRSPRAGDFGWVVSRHGAVYADEYGFDARFEALVAEIVAGFVRNFAPHRERCWIAERDGEPIGSVFLVGHGDGEAKLRLLLVDPAARGLGLGNQLVAACVGFARAAGYRRIGLWTQSILVAARRLYGRAGFRLVRCEPHHSFGHDLTGEYWELEL